MNRLVRILASSTIFALPFAGNAVALTVFTASDEQIAACAENSGSQGCATVLSGIWACEQATAMEGCEALLERVMAVAPAEVEVATGVDTPQEEAVTVNPRGEGALVESLDDENFEPEEVAQQELEERIEGEDDPVRVEPALGDNPAEEQPQQDGDAAQPAAQEAAQSQPAAATETDATGDAAQQPAAVPGRDVPTDGTLPAEAAADSDATSAGDAPAGAAEQDAAAQGTGTDAAAAGADTPATDPAAAEENDGVSVSTVPLLPPSD